jgi:hypothetical protein
VKMLWILLLITIALIALIGWAFNMPEWYFAWSPVSLAAIVIWWNWRKWKGGKCHPNSTLPRR